MRKYLAAAVFVAVSVYLPAFGQLITGTITGTVADQTGNSIPGARTTLVNEGTNETKVDLSNASGLFTFVAVNPGTYTIRIEANGFRTFERDHQVLQAGDHLSSGNGDDADWPAFGKDHSSGARRAGPDEQFRAVFVTHRDTDQPNSVQGPGSDFASSPSAWGGDHGRGELRYAGRQFRLRNPSLQRDARGVE